MVLVPTFADSFGFADGIFEPFPHNGVHISAIRVPLVIGVRRVILQFLFCVARGVPCCLPQRAVIIT